MTHRRPLAATLAALASLALLVPAAEATRVANCHYVESGAAGPAENYLHLSVLSDRRIVSIRRDGDAIGLSTARSASPLPTGSSGAAAAVSSRRAPAIAAGAGLRRALPCTGPVPTVFNLDKVSIVVAENISDTVLDLNLSGGPLAPGATDEGDGSSEIEIVFRSLGNEPFGQGVAIRGGPAAEQIDLGQVGRLSGVNLNAAEARPDVDMTMPRGSMPVVSGRGGDDTINAGGGPAFSGPAVAFVGFIQGGRGDDRLDNGIGLFSLAFGGPGDDRIRGRRGIDFLLGGRGRDRLNGRGFTDVLWGGKGRDEIRAGRGRDLVFARDHRRDLVFCGGGLDSPRVDRIDRTIGCERGPLSLFRIFGG